MNNPNDLDGYQRYGKSEKPDPKSWTTVWFGVHDFLEKEKTTGLERDQIGAAKIQMWGRGGGCKCRDTGTSDCPVP